MHDIVVATHGRSTQRWLQSADIILGKHMYLDAGLRWIATAFRCFPGCRVAATRIRDGSGCILAVRTNPRMLIAAGDTPIHSDKVEALARALYVWVGTRRGRGDSAYVAFLETLPDSCGVLTVETGIGMDEATPEVIVPCARWWLLA